MPDKNHETVSASQVPALFNRSPYDTRFMLHQSFAKKEDWYGGDPDERMGWGQRLEPAILKYVADELRLDVLEHKQDDYLRHPNRPVGCTPDGYVIDPQKGLGFIEVKNVDYLRWRDTWHDKAAPDHIELQHQTQLMVPHPEHGLPQWGVIAALIGGNEPIMFQRVPNPKVQAAILNEVDSFIDGVRNDNRPPVSGDPKELPVIAELFPEVVPDKIIGKDDLGEEWEEVQRILAEYDYFTIQEGMAKKVRARCRTKILAAAEDAQLLRVPGFQAKISKWTTAATVVTDDMVGDTLRKESTTQKITVKRFDDEIDDRPGIIRGGKNVEK